MVKIKIMKKHLFTLTLLCISYIVSSQNFTLTYDFAAVTSTTGLTDPTPSPTATGVTSGSFTAVGTPSANPNASNRFSFVGWPIGATNGNDVYATMTASLDVNEYYEITLTAQAGYTVTLDSLKFGIRRSGTGIRNYAVRYSMDSYSANLPASVGTNTNLSVVGTNEFFWNFDATSTSSDQNGSMITFSNTVFTNSISIRFYGWNAEASGGTFSIDNVNIMGSATDGGSPCNSPTITSISYSVVCANQTSTLIPTIIGTAPFTYTWITSGSGIIGSVNSETTTVTSSTPQTYTLLVGNACGFDSSAVAVNVNPLPTVTLDLSSINIQCVTVSSVALVGGMPSGGIYSGTAVTGGNFSPSTAGVGTYTLTYTYTDANNCTNIANDVMNVNSCTGINELTHSNELQLYPNPSSGIIHLYFPNTQSQQVTIELMNLNGQVIYNNSIPVAQSVSSINLDIPRGIYFIKVIEKDKTSTKKIVIQ